MQSRSARTPMEKPPFFAAHGEENLAQVFEIRRSVWQRVRLVLSREMESVERCNLQRGEADS